MLKKLTSLAVFLGLFFLSANEANAAIITLNNQKEFQWNVLGAISFTRLAQASTNSTTEIELKNDGDKVVLDYGSETDKSSIDVTKYSDEIVEIEKKTTPERVVILSEDGIFLIRQRGITAQTSYPIKINKNSENISVQTESGVRYITVLPYEAVLQTVRSNIVGDMGEDGKVEIVERSEGELAYKITGEKSFSVFKFFNVPVEVNAYVSALTGNVLEVDQPTWSRVLSFLLS